MGRTVIYPEPFNVVYFPCDISSVAFSLDSNYLAVAGGEGLVVFQANTQFSMFEPIARDVQKGVLILTLQWTAPKSIEYLCLGIQDGSLQIHRVNISPTKSGLVDCPAETSYTIDNLWKCTRTPRQRGNKTCRYEFGANGGYFAGVGARSVEIWKSSSESKPKHGFASDFTAKVEIISNTVRQLNKIEMQQSNDQDEDSKAPDKSYGEKDSQSVKKDPNPSPDAGFQPIGTKTNIQERYLPTGTDYELDAQKQPVLKRDRDEDEESSPVGKKPKQDHKDGVERPLLASKRGRDEDEGDTVDGEESLTSSKKAKFHEDKENQDVEKKEKKPVPAKKSGTKKPRR
jgi:hypothetical protein